MSNILTSGKDIQLHGLPSLASKFSFKYVSEPRKFITFPHENIIVSIYRDNRIDLLQAFQTNSGNDKIKRIKKLKLNGVTCASVFSNDGKYEIAMGLTNGNIEFVDYNTKAMLEKKFSCDVFGNSVENIDFNKDYDVLASTFQSGELQLFNMKNFRKLQRHRLDMKSDIVRFHPTNPHLLAVSSLSGALTVLNINIKKTMYSNVMAHKHYSTDICWLPSSPSTLMSVGGTTMKVFDIRQNVTLSATNHAYPYSTLAISPCEKFCCVGDMKGSIMSYDMRNIKTVMESNTSHEGSVTNLRFLPCSLEAELSTEDNVPEDDSDMERKKSTNRRTSAQNFFDQVQALVPPAKEQNDRRRSIDDFFATITDDANATKTVSNDLRTVPEENTMSESSNTNTHTSMEDLANESQFNLENTRHTLKSSETENREPIGTDDVFTYANLNDLTRENQLYSREPIGSDSVFAYANRNGSTPHHQLIRNHSNPFNQPGSAHHNAAIMYQMNEMSDKFEEKLQDLEVRVNERLMNMERKFDSKLDEIKEDLADQILHGFRSIHCNLWTVAETDVRDTKNMVAKIHENYSKIEDVFIENLLLKEELLKLKQRDLENGME